jgi:transglutaminase-like putative cysteine protease
MTFERVHKWVTYFLAGLGLYALSLGGTLSVSAMALTALGFVLSWFAERPLLDHPLWGKGWTGLVIGFFLLAVLRGAMGESLLSLALEYVAFLQISRLMNRKTGKDHDQIAGIGFLHLIAATILTTSIAYGLVFIGVCSSRRRGCSPSRTCAARWRRARPRPASTFAKPLSEKKSWGRGSWSPRPCSRCRSSSRRWGFSCFSRAWASVSPPCAASAGQPTTGFGKNVELGGFGTIREDPTVVLRVSGPAEALGPTGMASIRMRGTSFDLYDGRTWQRSNGGTLALRHDYGSYPIVRHPDRQRDFEYKVVLDRLDESVVFLPEGAVALTVPPRIAKGRDRTRSIRASQGFEFRYEETDEQGLNYSVFVSRDRREWHKGGITAIEAERMLKIPRGLERVVALANRVVGNAKNDREKATRILNFLRDSGQYRYSLTLPNTEGRNPLDVFLLEAKSGHCEYFSTAMAIMLRAVGVPTRNVTGFLGGSYNRYGEYYALRRADAHSWLEAWIDDRWVTLDPTPPARDAVGPPPSVLSPLRDFLDAVKTRWARQVVGYNLRTQSDAVRKAFGLWYKFRGWMRSPKASPGEANQPKASSNMRDEALAVMPFVAGAVVLVLLFVAFQLRRNKHDLRNVPPDVRSAVALYRELEDALRRRGVARDVHLTPSEHLDAIEDDARARGVPFEGIDEARDVTARYLRARFGADVLSREEESLYRAKVARVRAGPRVEAPR